MAKQKIIEMNREANQESIQEFATNAKESYMGYHGC
jgi:hypothetical protein